MRRLASCGDGIPSLADIPVAVTQDIRRRVTTCFVAVTPDERIAGLCSSAVSSDSKQQIGILKGMMRLGAARSITGSIACDGPTLAADHSCPQLGAQPPL